MKAIDNGLNEKLIWYNVDPATSPGVLPQGSGPLFSSTTIDGGTPTTQTFFVTQNYKGCEGNTESVNITIKSAPNANFLTPNICDGRPFTLVGPFVGGVPYSKYEWTLDQTVPPVSVLNDNSLTYNYGVTGPVNKVIQLTVTNSDGCINNSSQNPTIGANPQPNFTFNQICDGDQTVFAASTDIIVDQFDWDFGDGTIITRGPAGNSAPEGGTIKTPKHKFANTGDYSVTVTSYTPTGCSNPSTHQVSILEYLIRDTAQPIFHD